jgi:hypothetical protein
MYSTYDSLKGDVTEGCCATTVFEAAGVIGADAEAGNSSASTSKVSSALTSMSVTSG